MLQTIVFACDGVHVTATNEQFVVRLSTTPVTSLGTVLYGLWMQPARPPLTIPIPAVLARAGGVSPAATLQSGGASWLVQSTGELVYPIPAIAGDVITGFRVWGTKTSSSSTRLAATLMTVPSAGGVITGSATASNQLGAPGAFQLQVSGISTMVTAANSYIIEADSTTGLAQDVWFDAEVTVMR